MRTRQISVFLFLLAVSWIVDYRSYSFSHLPGTPGGLFILGGMLFFGAVLFQVGRVVPVLAAAGAGLVVLALDPHLSNHETLYVTLFLGILATWLLACFRERTFRVDVARQDEVLAAVCRLVFLVSYYWAAFHKWNDDFLEPAVSCAVYQIQDFTEALPILPAPAAFVAVAGHLTIAVELLLPTLLLVPATRRFGVLLGLGFHTILGVGFPAFQYLIFAFLALFVPEEVWRETFAAVARGVERVRPLERAARLLRHPAGRAALGVALAVGSGELFDAARRPVAQRVFGLEVYPAFSVASLATVALVGVALVLRNPAWRSAKPVVLFPGIPPLLLVLPAAVFLQGLQPHLGFKNVQAFAMFSNLATDDGQSNHWVIPASWQLSSNLRDYAIVNGASHPHLERLGSRHALEQGVLRASVPPRLVPTLVELRREVTRLAREGETGLVLDYTHGGVRRRVGHAERDPELANASFFERFYLKTRPIALNRYGACRW